MPAGHARQVASLCTRSGQNGSLRKNPLGRSCANAALLAVSNNGATRNASQRGMTSASAKLRYRLKCDVVHALLIRHSTSLSALRLPSPAPAGGAQGWGIDSLDLNLNSFRINSADDFQLSLAQAGRAGSWASVA